MTRVTLVGMEGVDGLKVCVKEAIGPCDEGCKEEKESKTTSSFLSE